MKNARWWSARASLGSEEDPQRDDALEVPMDVGAVVDEDVQPEPSVLRRSVVLALAQHGAEPVVAVEASGWSPMLNFVRLGLGLAVVNSICELPRGVVGVPLRDLPRLHSRLMWRHDPHPRPALDRVRAALVAGSPVDRRR